MNFERAEKLFYLIIIFWVALRTLLMLAQYIGNNDPVFSSEVLKFFTQAQIDSGKSYALNGFWFRFFYGYFFAGILLLLARSHIHFRIYDFLTEKIGSGLLRSDILLVFLFLLFLKFVGLPSAVYFGYWRESQAGFSNITAFAWFVRYLKAVAVGVTIELIAVMILLAVVRFFPLKWPLFMPAATGIFMLMLMILYPIIITPIFYNKKPLQSGEFRDGLLQMAENAGMEVEEVYVVDESRYSKHTNAYFSGFGRFRKIVLYDNLVNNHTPDEAAVIFAHEAGHWKFNHIAWGIGLGVAGIALIGAAVFFLFPALASITAFGLTKIDSPVNLPVFFLLYTVFQLFFAPVESQISQFMERQADRTALELTQNPEAYISSQIRLATDNKADLLPHPLRVFWLYSHPPALDRIKMAEAFIASATNDFEK